MSGENKARVCFYVYGEDTVDLLHKLAAAISEVEHAIGGKDVEFLLMTEERDERGD